MGESDVSGHQFCETRDATRRSYSGSGIDYDDVRGDAAGALLGEYDVSLAKRMTPFVEKADANNLEVGSVTGRFTIPFLESGFQITASDINEGLLQELRRKLELAPALQSRCDVRIEDGFSLSYKDQEVDGLLCIHVIPRFGKKTDQLAMISEFARVLKSGGKLLLNFSNKKSLLYGKMYRRHLISSDDIMAALRDCSFNIIEVRGKWLVNGTLLRKVPHFLRIGLIAVDKFLQQFWVSRAWDVFVLAEKT